MKNIPNILSALRIAMVGLFVVLFFQDKYVACFIVYAIAYFTDILDGFLARRYNWITDLGKLLDPVGDKLMLIAAVSCFAARDWIPMAIPIIVAVKELVILLGGLFLFNKKDVVVTSDWLGKIAAGAFNITVLLTLVRFLWDVEALSPFILPLFGICILLGVCTLIHYTRKQILASKSMD